METTSRIEPIKHHFVKEIIEQDKDLLFQLIEAFGSAVHILLPEVFEENVASFRDVLEKSHLRYKILYATKANKGNTFLEMCSKLSIGVDVASIFELRSALSHGVMGPDIGLSGPTKTEQFLLLATKQNSTISIDSYDEIETLISFIKKGLITDKIKILIRVQDVNSKESRFGIKRDQLSVIYRLISEYSEYFDFQGFSFHLSGYSIEERASAIGEVCELIDGARKMGFKCDTVDIGGGFTVKYLNQDGWDNSGLTNPDGEQSFYQGRRFDNFYPYSSANPREKFLEKLLSSQIKDTRRSVQELLRSNDIQLFIEPGRALLDQAGFTLTKVRGTRKSAKLENLVVVDSNFNSLSEQWFNSDFIPGPLHINSGAVVTGEPFVASVAGNTCMEEDVLTWRKIDFWQRPVKGDLLAYINTAGYQMDSNESEFHQLPLPEKITIFKGKDQILKWKKDRLFSQLDLT